jgi:hypothetical protein
MTKEDMRALETTLRAYETIHFRNIGLETLLEKFGPPNWSQLADELAHDERLCPDIRAKFRQAYAELEHAQLPNQSALVDLLRSLPVKGKPN